jgi:putative membrane protein
MANLVIAPWSAAQTPSSPPALASAAATSSATTLIAADRDFMIQTAIDGMAEIEMAKLALQRSSNAKIKQFADRMVQDHGKANGELKALAVSKGVSLPNALPRIQQDDLTQMGKLSGADFDKAYSLHMVGDHQKAVASFEKQASGTGDPQVKAFAAKILPTLRDHLAVAKGLDPGAAPK